MLKKLILILIILITLNSVLAIEDPVFIQLVSYNSQTRESKIHIQNNAEQDLHDVDLYINNVRTGRVAGSLPDGQAVAYSQSITPGTFNLTIKTKEGVEFSKQVEFRDTSIQAEESKEQKPKTASQLADDKEYQRTQEIKRRQREYLKKLEEEKKIKMQEELKEAEEKKVAEEAKRAELAGKTEPEVKKEITPEEVVKEKKIKKGIPNSLILFIVLIVIFFITFYYLRKKK